MAYRNIIVENPARITVKNEQLIIETDQSHSVPIEDISAVLLESNRSSVTTAALSRLGQCGCAVFVCDEKHLPCAVLQPFQQHSRNLAVLRSQLDTTEPRKKQLWQSVVKAKLRNQAACLELSGSGKAQELYALASRVRSGDGDNTEATGAQIYFPALFGAGFARGVECGVNSALNYGYAVLRGAMARYLALYGYLTCLGLHHCNVLNGYNLADDLMEPFRPVVDRLVYVYFQDERELTPAIKRQLFNCLNLEILSGGQRHSVSYAMERLVQSLGRAIDRKDELLLPELIELKQHSYE